MLKFSLLLATSIAMMNSVSQVDAQEIADRPLLSNEEVGSMLVSERLNASAIKQFDGLLKRVESMDTTQSTEQGISGATGQKTTLYRFMFDFERKIFCGVRKYTVEGIDFRDNPDGEKVGRTKLSAFVIDANETNTAELLYNGRRSSISTDGFTVRDLVVKSGPVGLKDFRRYAINESGRFSELINARTSTDQIEKSASDIAGGKWLDEKRYQFWSPSRKYRNGVEIKKYLTFDVDLVMPVATYSMVRSPGRDWSVAKSANRNMAWSEINAVVVPSSGKCLNKEPFYLSGIRDNEKYEVARDDNFHWFSVNDVDAFKKARIKKDDLDDQEYLLSLLDESVFEAADRSDDAQE